MGFKNEPMGAWRDVTLVYSSAHKCTNTYTQERQWESNTHGLSHMHTFTHFDLCTHAQTSRCICNHRRKFTHAHHTNARRLAQINCSPVMVGLSWGTLREHSTAHAAVSLSLVLYLKEIYLFDAILPSFGIHQVEYLSRDQKGKWEREDREGCNDKFKKL